MASEDACMMAVQDKKREVKKNMTDLYICCVCGEEYEDEHIHHIEIKDEPKKICNECATAIKGFI